MHFVNYIILRSFINGIASTLIEYIFFVCWEKICFESIMWQSDIHEKNGTEEGSPHNQKIPIIKVLNYQGPDYWGSNLKTSETLNPSDVLNVCNQQLWHIAHLKKIEALITSSWVTFISLTINLKLLL